MIDKDEVWEQYLIISNKDFDKTMKSETNDFFWDGVSAVYIKDIPLLYSSYKFSLMKNKISSKTIDQNQIYKQITIYFRYYKLLKFLPYVLSLVWISLLFIIILYFNEKIDVISCYIYLMFCYLFYINIPRYLRKRIQRNSKIFL